MTKLLIAFCTISACILHGATLGFVWDANPAAEQVVGYNLYDSPDATNLVRLLTVSTNAATLTNVAAGVHINAVSAVNVSGLESPLSNFVTSNIPSAPANVHRVITATLQSSPQVTGPWQNIAVIPFPSILPTNNTAFYRARLDVIP